MNRGIAISLLLATTVLIAGCGRIERAAPRADIVAPGPGSIAMPAWPGPPEDARIEYVSSFATPADLGIDESVIARLKRVIFGAREVHLIRPMSIVSDNAVTYVADPGARGVHCFDRARGKYRMIRAANDTALQSPVALAMDGFRRVFVADSAAKRVFVIEPRADFARPFTPAGMLTQPTGIAVTPAGDEIFVTDTLAHRVFVFDRDGNVVRDFGGRGDGTAEFNYPTLLWRTGQGDLLVADTLNFRVQRFGPDGQWHASFGQHGDGTGDMARQKGVATDSAGHVYVVDALFHAVQIFAETGEFLLSFGGQGHKAGEFWLPTGIFIDRDDLIYVADSYNRRVQVFHYLGGID